MPTNEEQWTAWFQWMKSGNLEDQTIRNFYQAWDTGIAREDVALEQCTIGGCPGDLDATCTIYHSLRLRRFTMEAVLMFTRGLLIHSHLVVS